MSKLIAELRREHSEILDALNRAKELAIDSKEAQDILLSIKEALIAYQHKEKEKICPVLKEAKDTLRFYSKYPKGGTDIGVAHDFGRLLGNLGKRIRMEEVCSYLMISKKQRLGC